MQPEDHPAFYDFGANELRIEQSKAFALWAIAAELHAMSRPNAVVGDVVSIKWGDGIEHGEIVDIRCYQSGWEYEVERFGGNVTRSVDQSAIVKVQ